MIGVLLENSDTSIVEEFFQLFKTPWQYYQPEHRLDVVMTDRQEVSGLDAPLIIIFHKPSVGSIGPTGSQCRTADSPIVVRQPGGPEFPIFTGAITLAGGNGCLTFEASGQCAGRLEVQGRQRILRLGFHLFDEVRFLLQHGQPVEFAQVPSLDIHIANLRGWILNAGIHLIEIPPHPRGNPFFACLTHDVDFAGIKRHKLDRTLAGFLYRALVTSTVGFASGHYPFRHLARNWMAVAQLPLIFAGLRKDFWFQIRNYLEIEKGCPSTFFLVPFKDTPGRDEEGMPIAGRAVKYDVTELKADIDYLLQHGCEVGVHGLDAWLDREAAEKELKKIQSLAAQDGLGVRMHWLCNNHDTPVVLEKAGYRYDSTWGFNQKPGFRAGTHQVFKPPQVETLLELPMHIMDTALFYPDRMNLSLAQGLETIQEFVDTAAIHGGALTLNWHHRSIAPERLWDGVYRDTLDALKNRAARFATARSIVDWFALRRSVVFEAVVNKGASIFVKVATDGRATLDSLEEMVLRVHIPKHGDQANPKASFKEYTLHSSLEFPAH